MGQQARLELHQILKKICKNVYYQPPSTVKMTYPCIVYNKSGEDNLFAGNIKYRTTDSYMITVIDRDPDSEIPDKVLKTIQSSSYQDSFVSNNLNHTVLSLNYKN